MSDWRRLRLGDVAPFNYGKSLPEKMRVAGQTSVYGSNGIIGSHDRPLIDEPMVVIGRKGSIGEVHYAPKGGWPIDTTFYVTDGPNLSVRFAYYLLDYLDLRHMSSDSAVPGLNRDAAHGLEVLIPPLSEQRAIAEVLGALDDKIEANQSLAALCDSTWRAIASSAVEGELVPLSSLARFVNGGAYTKGASGTGRVVMRTPELTSGPTGSTIYSDRDVPADRLARPGDLLFVWSGSLTVRRWVRTEAIINQHIFKVIPEAGVPMWLAHDRILDLLPEFISIAADKATTMGHIQRRHLDTAVLRPSADKLAVLDDACAPLWKRALKAERESLALAQLRDVLLPKLVSGELRVRDAEHRVEDAV